MDYTIQWIIDMKVRQLQFLIRERSRSTIVYVNMMNRIINYIYKVYISRYKDVMFRKSVIRW